MILALQNFFEKPGPIVQDLEEKLPVDQFTNIQLIKDRHSPTSWEHCKDKYINDCKALQFSTEGSTSEIRQLDRISEYQGCTINNAVSK